MPEAKWIDASFMLPRDDHLPVEVRLASGQIEQRKTVQGDWRAVVAWRSIRTEDTP